MTNGTLTVTPKPLIVTANLKVINRTQTLPALNATITGWVTGGANTVISGPTFTTSPNYTTSSPAGVYSIVPANLVLATPGNYAISYVNGSLYVNPKGQGAKKINVSLNCVDTVSNHPSGFNFLARFQWENQNNTAVYVLHSPTANYLTAAGSYIGETPELFAANTIGIFEIPFDGQSIQWTCISYNGNQQATATSTSGTANSNKCSAHLIRTIGSPDASGGIAILELYPNPTTGKITLKNADTFDNGTEVSVYDMLGKRYDVLRNLADGNKTMDMDMTSLKEGIYLIRVISNGNEQVLRVVKF